MSFEGAPRLSRPPVGLLLLERSPETLVDDLCFLRPELSLEVLVEAFVFSVGAPRPRAPRRYV